MVRQLLTRLGSVVGATVRALAGALRLIIYMALALTVGFLTLYAVQFGLTLGLVWAFGVPNLDNMRLFSFVSHIPLIVGGWTGISVFLGLWKRDAERISAVRPTEHQYRGSAPPIDDSLPFDEPLFVDDSPPFDEPLLVDSPSPNAPAWSGKSNTSDPNRISEVTINRHGATQ